MRFNNQQGRTVAHLDAVAPQSSSRRSQRYGVAEDPQWDVCKQEYCCAAVNAFPGEEVKGVVQATIPSMICLSLIFSSGSPVHSCLAKERLPLMARREFVYSHTRALA